MQLNAIATLDGQGNSNWPSIACAINRSSSVKMLLIERPESLHVFRTVLIKTLQLCKILHVKHRAISFCHLVMSSPLAKDLDPASELFRKDVDHLNLRLRDE
jgi:hypothetical protein